LIKKLFIFLFLFGFLSSFSQIRKRHYKQHEVGLFGGAAYYLGDLNPRTHFIYSKPAFGAFYRLSTGTRTAFRFGADYGSVYASDSKSKDAAQLERNLNFTSNIYDGYAIAEFNFVDYRIGSNKDYFTMFLFAGIGVFHFDPQSNVKGIGTVDLQHVKTEGQHYSKIQMNLPFGIGIKWNATKVIGFGFEWGPRKLFTDYLDDVSNIYPNAVGRISGTGDPQTMRGNPRTKDWYFYYGFTMQIRLPKKNIECTMGGS
jgi:hypothetical protein